MNTIALACDVKEVSARAGLAAVDGTAEVLAAPAPAWASHQPFQALPPGPRKPSETMFSSLLKEIVIVKVRNCAFCQEVPIT